MTKDQLAKQKGLTTYDCALPEIWLSTTFPDQQERETILCGTVWCYDTARIFGAPYPLTEEAKTLLLQKGERILL